MLNLLIKNGQIIDGTGSPGFYGTVLVEEETVSIHRGDTSNLEAQRVIDATGLVVCPGFVDLHSHAGLTILGEPHHDPKVRQGVTTELVGIDGISHAPFKTQEELHRYIWLDSGLNWYPPMPADSRRSPDDPRPTYSSPSIHSLAAASIASNTSSPGWNPARSMAVRTISTASSLLARSGANPPSSPTAVLSPFSDKTFFRWWKISTPQRPHPENVSEPTQHTTSRCRTPW